MELTAKTKFKIDYIMEDNIILYTSLFEIISIKDDIVYARNITKGIDVQYPYKENGDIQYSLINYLEKGLHQKRGFIYKLIK